MTQGEIYQKMLEQFEEETGYEIQGSGDMAVRLQAAAAQIMSLYHYGDYIFRQAFPQTAQEENLDRHGALRGVLRQEAQKAIGVLRFSVSRALSVPLGIETGTVCFNGEGTTFETVEDGLLLAGSTYVDVKAEAVEAGTRGNVVAGSITGMQTMPDGIETVTNPQRFTGGRERETDEAYRKRILEACMGLSNGANSAYYRKLAQSVDGIDEVAVIPRIHGAGTVGLLVMSDSGGVSQTAQDALNALLADRRELGIQVVVQEPENIGVNIQATFVPAEGYTLSQAKTAVQEAVVDYVDGLGLGKTLYPAGLYYSAMATGAIENVVFTQPTGAVTPEAGQQLVAGTVTLEGV